MTRASLFLGLILSLLTLSCNDDNPTVVFPDYHPPVIDWISPINTDSLSGTVELSFTVMDDNEVSSVRIYRNGIVPTGWTLPVKSDSLYSLLWNTTDVQDGIYVLEVRATDVSGNIGVSSILVVRIANKPIQHVDIRQPIVTIVFPIPNDILTDTVTIECNISDEDTMIYANIYISGEIISRNELLLTNGSVILSYDLNTHDFTDGSYDLVVTAQDQSGNLGMSVPVRVNILNNPDLPRVIWVPDEYDTIQGAINASEDGDTVRVRAGVYEEGLRMMGKNIWLESEEGPEVTTISGKGWNDGVEIRDGENFNSAVIRGFTIYGEETGINFFANSSARVYNCILKGSWITGQEDGMTGILLGLVGGDGFVYNCVFDGCYNGFTAGLDFGTLQNSILVNCFYGYYKYSYWNNWVSHSWNLFYNNEFDYRGDIPSKTDRFDDPHFLENSYIPAPNSPALDAGNPDMKDKDGTRCDIGVYGGPQAYRY